MSTGEAAWDGEVGDAVEQAERERRTATTSADRPVGVARETVDVPGAVESGFARADERLGQVDEHFARIHERFARVDERFAQLD
ncbi:MAG: hypothetical protein FWJ70_10305, partial [Micromonosporaceae bacterium]